MLYIDRLTFRLKVPVPSRAGGPWPHNLQAVISASDQAHISGQCIHINRQT
jgi:hypothetical protein